MAALIQTYQQQTGTVTMLQGRTTPSAGMMPAGQSNGHHQYTTQAPRGGGGYRGSTVPVQSYAFSTTPNMNQGMQWQQQFGSYRTNSAPSGIPTQTFDPSLVQRSHRPNPSVTNMALIPSYGGSHSSGQSSGHSSSHGSSQGSSHGSSHSSHGSARDDAVKSQSRNAASASRPQPSHVSTGSQSGLSPGGSSKNTPDRYRRPSNSNTQHSRSQSSNPPLSPGKPSQMYRAPSGSRSVPDLAASPSLAPGASMDDSNLHRRPSPDEAKKMRRRSVHTIQSTDSFRPLLKPENASRQEQAVNVKKSDRAEKPSQGAQKMPVHVRKGSSDSASSSRSSHSRSASSSNRNAAVSTGNPSSPGSDETPAKGDQLKVANVPARGSSSDGVKRTLSPSPLSKPATMANESSGDAAVTVAEPSGKNMESPAAKQLAAINEKDVKGKTKTSRLRRAFSFGSAAEFRKAAAEGEGMGRVEVSKLRKDPTAAEVYDAEQARIAEAQEAAGIGNSIYGGRFFGGSTDNLSISSTASSASIMIRKMGRGMKKSTRSLVGLFRPKSVVGVPAADGPVTEAGQAAVSMITVEAETRRVNVTADPQSGHGGTGFPRLERNSLDATQIPEIGAERLGSAGTDNSGPRKSIVGGDKERAEVLAAVRKGILKRSSSPSIRPSESPDLVLPNIPAVTDSPNSSAPSTPNDEAHKRTGSIAIGNEDYFMGALRLGKSRPGTPQAGTKRNATFSPRIIFYDTWPSQEYDRRGEIATCNRLTPMLAQQIKEELNSFKMEMEVHENSKIYTHFF